jgi:hypothetical protein
MSDGMDQFEQRLSRQPVKPLPAEWRAEILAATRAAQTAPPRAHPSFLAAFNQHLSALLWPHPQAWAGLATVWVIICLLNLSTGDRTPALAEKSTPPSPQLIADLQQQQKMLAELIWPSEAGEAGRRPLFVPKPRSGRPGIFAG